MPSGDTGLLRVPGSPLTLSTSAVGHISGDPEKPATKTRLSHKKKSRPTGASSCALLRWITYCTETVRKPYGNRSAKTLSKYVLVRSFYLVVQIIVELLVSSFVEFFIPVLLNELLRFLKNRILKRSQLLHVAGALRVMKFHEIHVLFAVATLYREDICFKVKGKFAHSCIRRICCRGLQDGCISPALMNIGTATETGG